MANKITKSAFKEAVRRSFGSITQIATTLQCSRQTVYNLLKRFPDLQTAIEDEKEIVLDLAEHKLYEQVSNGNFMAIKYLLDSKGKSRGYGVQKDSEKSEQTDMWKDLEEYSKQIHKLAENPEIKKQIYNEIKNS